MSESDPHGRSAKEAGSKLDAGKAPIMRGVLQYFPRALAAVAEVSQKGAEKYTWRGWATVPDGVHRYGDALGRHILAEANGPIDAETGCLHAAQVAWNALARLELMLEQDAVVGLPFPLNVTGADRETPVVEADEIPGQHCITCDD